MAGGPINGSGAYPFDLIKTTPAATILVPTMLQIGADVVDSFKNLTCLYDRYWYNRADVMTLPICFFYVKSMHEIIRNETSKQRILLYEPQLSGADTAMAKLADPIRKGVQEVVVDNSVGQPKQYNLEIILPFMPMSKQFGRTMIEAQQIFEAYAEIFAGSVGNFPGTDSMNILMKGGKLITDAAGVFSNNPGAKHINKNSLEAMGNSQRVLTMKVWSGYEYRYVQIINIDITKSGNEDDVFRASLQVEERPVLTMTPASDAVAPSQISRNWAASVVTGALNSYTALAAEFTGVRQASGGIAGQL